MRPKEPSSGGQLFQSRSPEPLCAWGDDAVVVADHVVEVGRPEGEVIAERVAGRLEVVEDVEEKICHCAHAVGQGVDQHVGVIDSIGKGELTQADDAILGRAVEGEVVAQAVVARDAAIAPDFTR